MITYYATLVLSLDENDENPNQLPRTFHSEYNFAAMVRYLGNGLDPPRRRRRRRRYSGVATFST